MAKPKVAKIKYIGPGNYWVCKLGNKHLLKGTYMETWTRKIEYEVLGE